MSRWKTFIHNRLSRSRLPVYFALVVLLVILMLILPIYWIYSDKLRNQLTYMNESLIDQVLATYDGLLQEVDRASVRIAENVNVNRFIFLQKNGLFDDEVEYQLFLKTLYGIIASEQKFYPNIGGIYLYIPRTEVIITADTTLELDRFADRDYVRLVAGGAQQESWSGVRTSNARLVSGYPISEQVLTFHRSLSNDGLVNDAILFFDVKMSLFKQPERFSSAYPLALRIADASGRVIYAEAMGADSLATSEGAGAGEGDSRFIGSTALSAYNAWSYTVTLPKNWLFAPMQFISRMTFLLAIVVLAFGLLVSLYFSRRFHRPLEAALAQWRGRIMDPYGSDTIPQAKDNGSLQESIQSLVRSSLTYADLVEANRGTIRNAMLLDLLRNNEWPSDMDTPVGLRLKRGGPFYRAVTCVRDGLAEMKEQDKELIQYAVGNLIRETFEQSGGGVRAEIAALDDQSFGIILFGLPPDAGGPVGEPSEAEVADLFAQVLEQLRPYEQFTWTFGIGSRCADDGCISLSYRESQLAVQYRVYRGKGSVISFGELKADDHHLAPVSDEWIQIKDKVMAGIRSRDAEQARRSVDELCDWLARTPGGGSSRSEWNRIHYIGYSVFTEIEKLIYDLNLDRTVIYPHDGSFAVLMDSNPTVVEIRQLMLDTCNRMIDALHSRPPASKSSYVAAIADYMRAEYSDQQLSLESVAERFGINPSYLGQRLKKELNLTFLQLLSEIRITHAKALLAESSVQIQDVATQVGYGNRSTFIRIFKAHVGLTPSDYRNRIILERERA